MAGLGDFGANGIRLGDGPRKDVDLLLESIPERGNLHVAILRQPYLNLIVAGTKTIESRFNTKRATPYGRVATGDLVLLKESGKPITNFFFAGAVQSIDLSSKPIAAVREEYSDAICPEDPDAFWREKALSRFCTLIAIGEQGVLEPLAVHKQDQRGWVTLTRDHADPVTLF